MFEDIWILTALFGFTFNTIWLWCHYFLYKFDNEFDGFHFCEYLVMNLAILLCFVIWPLFLIIACLLGIGYLISKIIKRTFNP